MMPCLVFLFGFFEPMTLRTSRPAHGLSVFLLFFWGVQLNPQTVILEITCDYCWTLWVLLKFISSKSGWVNLV